MVALPFDTTRLTELCRQNDVAKLSIFGSMARGEANAQSDIDLLVEFSKRKSLLASLKQFSQPEQVGTLKLGWKPELRLAVALLAPIALPHIASALSLDMLQTLLEVLIHLGSFTILLTVLLKPHILGSPKDLVASQRA